MVVTLRRSLWRDPPRSPLRAVIDRVMQVHGLLLIATPVAIKLARDL
jgi:hypothetical protein